jgi:aminopeptidase N
MRPTLLLAASLALLACPTPEPEPEEPAPAEQDWSGDVVHSELAFDLDAMEGRATVRIATDGTAVSLEAGGLDVARVLAGDVELPFAQDDDRLDVGLLPHTGSVELTVEYEFEEADLFEGLMEQGMTLTWPYHCGNLFPCRSEPSDGATYSLSVDGGPDGTSNVAAPEIPGEAPAYQVAWSTGDYAEIELGATPAGTALSVWHLPDSADDALAGAEHLVAVFDWYEQTLGPYPFGDKAGGVEVDWGPWAYGGMEHHPWWHISGPAVGDIAIHAHEAAHGWFGGGVRLACWEDVVLSEGTATYLTARSMGQAIGPEAEEAVWADYDDELDGIFAGGTSPVVLFDSCGELDPLDPEVYGRATYVKGAGFWRDVAARVGADELDAALASFFVAHVGGAARMAELVAHVAAETGADLSDLVDAWLYGTADPRP